MLVIDRTQAPEVKSLNSFSIIKARKLKLANGIPVYSIKSGTQEIVKIELVFNAGNYFEMRPGLAFLTTKMLNEGTASLSAKDISEKIAFYGASLELFPGNDKISISMTALTKHLPYLLPLLQDIVQNASFPEENFENLKNIQSQQLKINMQKTAFVASGLFKHHVFGENHPYGYFLSPEILESLSVSDCVGYHASKIKDNSYEIIISGMVTDAVITDIERVFGSTKTKFPTPVTIKKEARGSGKNRVVEAKENSLQCSLRIGRKLFTRNHPDYIKFLVLNEALGGYFGSRLMKNIREEKGLTYGIYSQAVSMINEGFFVIGTDVKKELAETAVSEIYKEIEALKFSLISDEELNVVKNYMLGSFMGSLNTHFQLGEKFKTIHFSGMEYSFFDKYIETIKTVSAKELMQLAEKYFDKSNFTEVIVG